MEPMRKPEEQAVFALRELYRSRGYRPYKMSRFEAYDLYVENKDFLQSDRVITFSDRGGRLLAMKPDVTLSIIKNAPDHPGQVQKVYYNENVYRADSGIQGFREILQTGLECVGDLGAYEIAEVALLAARSLALLGSGFVLNLSHMGFVWAVLDNSGLSASGRKEALGFLRQKNSHELLALCRRENIGEAGAGKLLALIREDGNAETVCAALLPLLDSGRERELLEELSRVCRILTGSGFGGNIRLEFSVGNEMKYYSGLVFKGYLEGIPVSVLSGGQYDRLLRKMGRASRAIGFAINLNLLETRNPREEVDILLLHDPSEPAERVMEAVESLPGSVLAATELPPEGTFQRIAKLGKEGIQWLNPEC